MTLPAPSSVPPPPDLINAVVEVARAWPSVELTMRTKAALELHVAGKEIGHLHAPARVDIPFPRPVGEALLQEGRAHADDTLRQRGRVRIVVKSRDDVQRALQALHLSYLYRMTMQSERPGMLDRIRVELRALPLSSRIHGLLEGIVARREQSLAATARPQTKRPLPKPPATSPPDG
jgi:hypothetical protein